MVDIAFITVRFYAAVSLLIRKKQLLPVLCFYLFFLPFIYPCTSYSVPIASYSFETPGYHHEAGMDSLELFLGFSANGYPISYPYPNDGSWNGYAANGIALFNVQVGKASVGNTFLADLSSNAFLNTNFVLTDGEPELGLWRLKGGGSDWDSSLGFTEWIFHDDKIVNTPDLKGYYISNIALMIESFYEFDSYYDLLDDRYYSRYSVKGAIIVDGEPAPVPEPSTFLLFMGGAVLVFRRLWRVKSVAATLS